MNRIKTWRWGGLTLLGVVLLAACSAWIAGESNIPTGTSTILLWQWGAVLLSLLIVAVCAGHLANGRWIGVLIDDRNRISLGRLQWFLWFLTLFSAYFTGRGDVALRRPAGGRNQPVRRARHHHRGRRLGQCRRRGQEERPELDPPNAAPPAPRPASQPLRRRRQTPTPIAEARSM